MGGSTCGFPGRQCPGFWPQNFRIVGFLDGRLGRSLAEVSFEIRTEPSCQFILSVADLRTYTPTHLLTADSIRSQGRSATNNLTEIAMRMDSRRLISCPKGISIPVTLGLVIGLTFIAQPRWGCSQTAVPNPDTRAVPAPWRPSLETPNTNPTASGPQNQQAQPNLTPPGQPSAASGFAKQANPPGQNPKAAGPVTTNNSSPPTAPATYASNTNGSTNNVPPQQSGPGVTQLTRRLDELPNAAGQVWREYDIKPYTSKVTATKNPQQAILDWILRETGKDMWFNDPLGILHINRNQLYVYHTPEIHQVIKSIVDRFIRTRGQLQRIDVNLVTVENPNWRAESYTMLQPIEVRAPGVEAWMISKENAALLQGQLRRRIDFKQHSAGTLTNHDGQTFELENTRPVQFVRNLRWVPNQNPNYQPLMTNISEGYSLEISSLTSLDNHTIEAMIKCEVDQVEKLTNVRVNIPGVGGGLQQMNLQVPQLVSWRLHERFRWPSDQVLLLSCGVVATPEPETPRAGGFRIPILDASPKRADALLFIEYRGPATGATLPRTANSGLTPIQAPR